MYIQILKHLKKKVLKKHIYLLVYYWVLLKLFLDKNEWVACQMIESLYYVVGTTALVDIFLYR